VKTITIGDSLIGTLSMKPKENIIKSNNYNNDEMNTQKVNNNIV
jgi:hypothetical protein